MNALDKLLRDARIALERADDEAAVADESWVACLRARKWREVYERVLSTHKTVRDIVSLDNLVRVAHPQLRLDEGRLS